MLTGFLALIVLFVRLFPDTPAGRALHEAFVERPLDFARRVERRHIILLAVILCCGQTLALAGSAELAMVYAVDLSLYFEAAFAAYLASAAMRVRDARAVCSGYARRIAGMVRRPRPRSRTSRPAARPQKPSNDDERQPGRLRAAA